MQVSHSDHRTTNLYEGAIVNVTAPGCGDPECSSGWKQQSKIATHVMNHGSTQYMACDSRTHRCYASAPRRLDKDL